MKTTLHEVGTEGYEVEWCYELPIEDGDAQMEKAKWRRVVLTDLQDAKKLAEEVYPQDQFGAVLITQVVLTDPHEGTRYAGIRSEFRWEPQSEWADKAEYSNEWFVPAHWKP